MSAVTKPEVGGKLVGWLAIDQYGQNYRLTDVKFPRKQLLKKLGRSHADIMYCDLKSGGHKQTGYIIGGLWLDLYEVRTPTTWGRIGA